MIEITNPLIGIMSLLVIVELILTYGIFTLRKGMDKTRKTMERLEQDIRGGLVYAESSTESLKFISDKLKEGKKLFKLF